MNYWERRKAESELELWKAIGDELVFVADIRNIEDVPLLVAGFRNATNGWNKQNEEYESRGVTVKAAAWLAGFPVMNSVIPGDSVTSLDFLGTSMDIGFRLCGFATPRRFVLSIDLAYVLAVLGDSLTNWCRFLDKLPLKGVLKNRPYPVFWLDCFSEDIDASNKPKSAKLAQLEDRVTGNGSTKFLAAEMESFSKCWIESTGGDLILPFCPHGDDSRFPIPESYSKDRENALSELEREFLEQGDIGLDEGQDDDVEEFRGDIDRNLF